MQRGGNLLNKGSYGCIISPNRPCRNSLRGAVQSEEYVSKLFYGENGVINRDQEWEELQAVARIDPEFKFTIEPIESCSIWNGSGDVLKCTNKAVVPQIILRNGGPDLHGFEKGKIKPIRYNEFLKSFYRLVKGFKAMERGDMVHRDVKPGNILYNQGENKFYLVDFGLACKKSEVYHKSNGHLLEYVYPYYPPEFRILGYLYKLGKSEQQMVDLLSDVLRDRKKFESTDIMHEAVRNMIMQDMDSVDIIEKIDEHKDDVYVFLKELMDSIRGGKFRKFADDMSSRADIYSLGVTMYYLYDNDFIECDDGVQEASLEFIFERMVNANPSRRFSADAVLQQLGRLMKTKK
jgi:serine/threonine protein kinase